MIYVTGDMHGDLARFQAKGLRRLRKNDSLIVCGDFGFLWDGSKKERRALKWIGRRRYNVLFVEGTHDNLDLLREYPTASWNGGTVREISGRLRHLCRGEVFRLEGRVIFAFGGGASTDADTRPGSWWSGELPAIEELAAARQRLAENGDRVDYIVTHQCCRKLKDFLGLGAQEVSVLDTFFDQVRAVCSFKRWFFGGYHINKLVPPNQHALYDAVVPIDANPL